MSYVAQFCLTVREALKPVLAIPELCSIVVEYAQPCCQHCDAAIIPDQWHLREECQELGEAPQLWCSTKCLANDFDIGTCSECDYDGAMRCRDCNPPPTPKTPEPDHTCPTCVNEMHCSACDTETCIETVEDGITQVRKRRRNGS